MLKTPEEVFYNFCKSKNEFDEFIDSVVLKSFNEKLVDKPHQQERFALQILIQEPEFSFAISLHYGLLLASYDIENMEFVFHKSSTDESAPLKIILEHFSRWSPRRPIEEERENPIAKNLSIMDYFAKQMIENGLEVKKIKDVIKRWIKLPIEKKLSSFWKKQDDDMKGFWDEKQWEVLTGKSKMARSRRWISVLRPSQVLLWSNTLKRWIVVDTYPCPKIRNFLYSHKKIFHESFVLDENTSSLTSSHM
jgi:hypothetical protein